MKVVLIYNPKSGSSYDLRTLKRLFKAADIQIEYSFTTNQFGSKKLDDLIKHGRIVAVVGGDGTLNAMARKIVGSKSTMLPLPGGTFNHFVRDLGMDQDVEAVLSGMSRAKERMIDVGMVNDELFLNNSNIGMYPFSLIERKTTKRVFGKHVAAVLSAVDQLSLFRRHKLVIDGEKIRSPFMFIGNNVYDIRASLIPQRTGFTKNTLTVMIATSRTRMALIGSVLAVVRGNVAGRDDFVVTRRREMTVYSTERTIPVSFDGEVKRLTPPLEYRVRPRCLRVLTVSRRT